MDKARHPQVIRTWTVERTKVPYRALEPAKQSSNTGKNARATEKRRRSRW